MITNKRSNVVYLASLALVLSCTNPTQTTNADGGAVDPDPNVELAREGFVLTSSVGSTGQGTFEMDTMINLRTGEIAYLPVGAAQQAPVLIMKNDRVERQLGAQTPSYVGMTQTELTTAMRSALAGDPPPGDQPTPYYGKTDYGCCVQTCVNNNLASLGCTGVGNLLPYCTQAAVIATGVCGFSCLNDAVACSLAPKCGCGPVCGDGICDLANGESCNNCSSDCGACGGGCFTAEDCGGGGGGGCGEPGAVCEDPSECCSNVCDPGGGICGS
jgi:hypothetical protein